MKMHFAFKVAMFQQCLVYGAIIIMCYCCQIKFLANRIALAQTWTITKAICDAFSLL
jgi:hypothetical protein